MPHPRVAVVGGGVLGLLVCERLQAKGAEVTLYRLSDRGSPSSDTQRNHGWKQSGLLYRDVAAPHVLAMQASGDMLLSHVGLDSYSGRGIFAVANTDKAYVEFIEAAQALGLQEQVHQLERSRAAYRLGPFFSQDRYHFRVPDSPFDEATILLRLRQLAKRRGVGLYTSDSPVTLDVSSGRALLNINGATASYDAIVAVAGAGLPQLLHEVCRPGTLRVSRSVLLVLSTSGYITEPMSTVDLFADRETGLSVVRHPGCLVIGSGAREVVTDPCGPRRVTAQEQIDLIEMLPSDLVPLPERARWTAGYKTEHVNADGLERVTPWIGTPSEFGVDCLYAALPGKATLAWYTASRLTEMILTKEYSRGDSSLYSPVTPTCSEWTEPIEMHFSSYYAAMNEAERRGSGGGRGEV